MCSENSMQQQDTTIQSLIRKKRFLPDPGVVQAAELRLYAGLITVSAFSLAIGVGLALQKYLTFTYHHTSDVVGWISVNQYPKQQEFFYYLLALLGIPTVICLYWFGWQFYSHWAAKLTAQPVQHVLKANALGSLPLWLCWLQLFHLDAVGPRGLVFLFFPLGLSTFVKLGLLYNRFLPTLQNTNTLTERPIETTPNSQTVGSTSHAKTPVFRQVGRLGFEYVIFPIFMYLLMYSGNIDGNIDLFHEGERLAPLNEMLRGGIPFRDIYVQHGLFQNAYLAWFGSQIFEPTLEGVRAMGAVLAPLGYVALYLLGLQVFRGRWLTAFISVMIASSSEFSVSTRHALGLLSFAMVANFLTSPQAKRFRTLEAPSEGQQWVTHSFIFGWKLILAGIFTSLAFWYSTEIGLYSLGSIALFLLMYSLQSRISLRLSPLPLISYVCGVLLGFLPLGIYFLSHGALDDVLWNTYIQCHYQLATWGLAFPSLSTTLATLTTDGWRTFLLSEGFRWYLPIGVFLVIAAYLTYRGLRQALWTSESVMKLLLLLLGGIAFFRTALGRSDGGHLIYGSTFLWLLCLLPLDRGVFSMVCRSFAGISLSLRTVWGFLTERTRWRAVLKTAWVLIPLWLFFQYVGAVHRPLVSFSEKWQRLRQNPFTQRVVPEELVRAGGVDIPDNQVEQIQKVVAYIQEHTAPNEKIFDFTSQGSYYFFANRPSVTRFHQASYASTPKMQREVISALTRDRTRLVLFKTGGWFDAVDGIPVEERHPLIAQYLQDNYTLAIDINGTQILWRENREKP